MRALAVAPLILAAFFASVGTGFADPTNTVRILTTGTNAASLRPVRWAVAMPATNLSNFYRVTSNLFRGAQPSTRGMAELKTLGVRTVVNLRSFHSDRDELRGFDFKPARLHMKPWHAEEEDVVAFLKIAADTNNYPIFVHCQRGADRTGLVCAMYRIVFCGWTKEDAIEEMTKGGFKFDPRWQNIVNYVQKSDVEELKKKAGVVQPLDR